MIIKFTKDFESVNHDKLLIKLRDYQIQENTANISVRDLKRSIPKGVNSLLIGYTTTPDQYIVYHAKVIHLVRITRNKDVGVCEIIVSPEYNTNWNFYHTIEDNPELSDHDIVLAAAKYYSTNYNRHNNIK